MSEEEILLDRIRTHVYLNDIHLIEWFEDFDKLRTGRVSREQFRRCFEFAKFSLTENEWNYLCQEYAKDDDVDYRDFCHDVSKIFTNPDLEVTPKGELPNTKEIVTKITNRISTNMPQEVTDLFEILVHQVTTKGIHIREAFMDFDKSNCGRVTKSQFLRNLPFEKLTQKQIQILLDRYLDPKLGDVNYKRLHLDVIDFQNLPEQKDIIPEFNLPHHKQSIKLHPLPSDPETVIDRFAEYVHKNRVRIRDFFDSHDPLHSGRVTPDMFMNVLTLFGFQFSPEELNDLAERYKIRIDLADYVRYKEFCLDVDRTAKAIRDSIPQPPAPYDRQAQAVISKVKEFIAKNRINVLPPFQDFDRTNRGYVTELQFHRVLSLMTIPVSTDDVRVLLAIYGGKADGVDYFRFVEDIDPDHAQSRRTFKSVNATIESIENTYGHTPSGDKFVTPDVADQLIYESKKGLLPKTKENKSITELLGDIQRWCYIHSVDLHDFIKDFDPLNTGEVTDNQLRSSMNVAGYRVTDDEFKFITDAYRSERNPDKVLWSKFADDILAFIAPKRLEQTPRKNPVLPSTVMAETRKQELSGNTGMSMTAQVQNILEKVNKYAVQRRISLSEQFQDKDRHKHKQVSTISFAQVMQLIGVHLSMNEINLLAEYYLDPVTHFVNYPTFVKDVEALGGINFPEYTELVVNKMPTYAGDINTIVATKPPITAEQLTWNKILSRIQSYIYKRRIRLMEFFENFDHLRHGNVTQQKWYTVVGETNLPIVEDEIQFIGKMFAVEGHSDLFNYRDFLDIVDQIFYTKDLHRNPTMRPNETVSFIPDPSVSTSVIPPADEYRAAAIIERMRNFVTTRRMEIRQQFEDYDKAPPRNYITRAQFRQCIGRLGLTSDSNELDILCKKYRCTELDEMNYRAFCTDVGGYLDYHEQQLQNN